MKSQLKHKQGYTDVQAMNYLMEHGYIKVKKKSITIEEQEANNVNDVNVNNVNTTHEKPEHITDEFVEQYLLRLAMSSEPDSKVGTLLVNWADKKDMLTKVKGKNFLDMEVV
jgi:hypothetical protein